MNFCVIKYKNENKFNYFKILGANVIELDSPEQIDEKMQELYKQNYTNILISNEIASFSQDIIRKYNKKKNIKIIIAPGNINE